MWIYDGFRDSVSVNWCKRAETDNQNFKLDITAFEFLKAIKIQEINVANF